MKAINFIKFITTFALSWFIAITACAIYFRETHFQGDDKPGILDILFAFIEITFKYTLWSLVIVYDCTTKAYGGKEGINHCLNTQFGRLENSFF